MRTLLAAEPYVSGNVGSAPSYEMAEWVEYMTSPTGSSLAKERAANGRKAPWKLPMFGLGNELWGCGGNMQPEYAADLHVGLTNVDPGRPATVSVRLDGVAGTAVTGRILTAPTIDAHNSFDAPNAVAPAAFTGATLAAGTLTVTLPPKSVVMLDIR